MLLFPQPKIICQIIGEKIEIKSILTFFHFRSCLHLLEKTCWLKTLIFFIERIRFSKSISRKIEILTYLKFRISCNFVEENLNYSTKDNIWEGNNMLESI